MTLETTLLTVKDLPRHHTVGRFFVRPKDGQVFYCKAYESVREYCMVGVSAHDEEEWVTMGSIRSVYQTVWDCVRPTIDSIGAPAAYWAVHLREADRLEALKLGIEQAAKLEESVGLFTRESDALRFINTLRTAFAAQTRTTA